MPKKPDNQPSFDFGEPMLIVSRLSDLDTFVEQIARDVTTLAMDETFWEPSREFYEQRIVAYRETVLALQGAR